MEIFYWVAQWIHLTKLGIVFPREMQLMGCLKLRHIFCFLALKMRVTFALLSVILFLILFSINFVVCMCSAFLQRYHCPLGSHDWEFRVMSNYNMWMDQQFEEIGGLCWIRDNRETSLLVLFVWLFIYLGSKQLRILYFTKENSLLSEPVNFLYFCVYSWLMTGIKLCVCMSVIQKVLHLIYGCITFFQIQMVLLVDKNFLS